MHLQKVRDSFQLKQIKKFPIPLPPSAVKYGSTRRSQGLEVYYLLAALPQYLVVLVGSKELPMRDADLICELALQRNAEGRSGLVIFDGGLVMVEVMVAEEKAVTVEVFNQLVEEIREIRLYLKETVNVFPLAFPQAVKSFFPAPDFRRSHAFSSLFTEETYEVQLFAYQKSGVIYIYSVLCTVKETGLGPARAFLHLCNEQLVPGVFKLRKNEVIFEMWMTYSENCGDLTVQTYCDLVAKYTHCYRGSFTVIANPSTAEKTLTLRKALMLCKDNLKDMDRRSEVPDQWSGQG